jgi:uncharacterized protein (DUF1330 family)
LAARLDPTRVADLLALRLPKPIHALNLVHFRDLNSYRLYGLLLAPYAAARGARPLWAGVLDEPVLGSDPADEIVVVSYPDQHVFMDIVSSRYYSWVNRWRVKGVRRLRFGVTELTAGNVSLRAGGHWLTAQSDDPDLSARIASLADPYLELCYSSVVRSALALFRTVEPGDPEPLAAPHFSLLLDRSAGAARERLRAVAGEIERVCAGSALHWYRAIGPAEALPYFGSGKKRNRK